MTGDGEDTTDHTDDAGPGGETPPLPGMTDGARDAALHPADRGDGPGDDCEVPDHRPGRIGALRLSMKLPWPKDEATGKPKRPPRRLIEEAYPALTEKERKLLKAVYGTEGTDPVDDPATAIIGVKKPNKETAFTQARTEAEASLIAACEILAAEEAEMSGDHTHHTNDPEADRRG